MSDVSSHACSPMIDAVRAAGLAPENLFAGAPHCVDDFFGEEIWIAWDEYLSLLEHCVSLLGGVDALAAAIATLPNLLPVMSGLVYDRSLADSAAMQGAHAHIQSVFACTRTSREWLSDGRVRDTVEILPAYQDSELFFHTIRAFIYAAPKALGKPVVHVEQVLQPRRAVFTITPSAPRLLRFLRTLLSAGSKLRHGNDYLSMWIRDQRRSSHEPQQPDGALAEERDAVMALSFVGHRLAQHVDIDSLADEVMLLIAPRFRLRGAAFYGEGEEKGVIELLSRAGENDGPPSTRYDLTLGRTSIGRIDLWGSDDEIARSRAGLLEELIPWFAMALNNARAFRVLERQTRRLRAEIEARERAEEQSRRAQKLEAVGRIAGGVAHDFNNILAAITTFAELAQQRSATGAPSTRELEGILTAAGRGARLVKDLLAFSRREVAAQQFTDVNRMLLDMLPLLRQLVGERIELAIAPSDAPAVVVADPARLEQAIVNLVSNSRDAMPSGGSIRVEIASETKGEVGAPDGFVNLSVRDSGCGMSRETRARMFEPFFTTKPAGTGTGLGLATLYDTVTQCGGTVTVESEPEIGTLVVLRLPRASADAICETSSELAPAPRGGGESLLLVEDDAALRVGLRRVLAESGYRVMDAADPDDALRLCALHRPGFDLLVTDVGLPQIDGFDLARRITLRCPELRGVVFTSGYADPESIGERRLDRPHSILPKPFTRLQLLEAIRHILDS